MEAARRTSFGGDSTRQDSVIAADNLVAMESLAPATFDLVYVDPPFATGKARRGRAGSQRSPSYQDPIQDPDEFVTWLMPRLSAMRDLLAPTGSLFVHLDHRVVHYVKVALDRLFGRNRFVNEIVWCYSVGGKSGRRFARKHDTILWYGRSSSYAFYPDAVRVPRKPKSHMRVTLDEDGKPVQEKTDRKTGKVYRYPVALGKVPEDWWTDIETLNRSDSERTGYPTQKPERLLQRVVDATTSSSDLVGDFFAGSGTTGAVAQRGQRNFVLSDQSLDAATLCYERLCRQGRGLAERGTPPAPLRFVELSQAGAREKARSLGR